MPWLGRNFRSNGKDGENCLHSWTGKGFFFFFSSVMILMLYVIIQTGNEVSSLDLCMMNLLGPFVLRLPGLCSHTNPLKEDQSVKECLMPMLRTRRKSPRKVKTLLKKTQLIHHHFWSWSVFTMSWWCSVCSGPFHLPIERAIPLLFYCLLFLPQDTNSFFSSAWVLFSFVAANHSHFTSSTMTSLLDNSLLFVFQFFRYY